MHKMTNIRLLNWRGLLIILLFHFAFSSFLYWASYNGLFSSLHNNNGAWFFARDTILYFYESEILLEKYIDGIGFFESFAFFPNHLHIPFMAKAKDLIFPGYYAYFLFSSLIYVSCIGLVYVASNKFLKVGKKSSFAISAIFLFPSFVMMTAVPLREVFLFFGLAIIYFSLTWINSKDRNFSFTPYFLFPLGVMIVIATKAYLMVFAIIALSSYLVIILFSKKENKILIAAYVLTLISILTNSNIRDGRFDSDSMNREVKNIKFLMENAGINSSNVDHNDEVALNSKKMALNYYESKIIPKKAVDVNKESTFDLYSKRLIDKINYTTLTFLEYPDQGSRIEDYIIHDSIKSLVSYLPIAIKRVFIAPPLDDIYKESKTLGKWAYFVAVLENTIILGLLIFSISKIHMLSISSSVIIILSILLMILLGYILTNYGAIIRLRMGYVSLLWIFLLSNFFANQKKFLGS